MNSKERRKVTLAQARNLVEQPSRALNHNCPLYHMGILPPIQMNPRLLVKKEVEFQILRHPEALEGLGVGDEPHLMLESLEIESLTLNVVGLR